MKYLLGILFLLVCSPLFALPINTASVQPAWEDGGNDWRPISVAASTNIVLISSAPQFATVTNSTSTVVSLGISEWRSREIVNTATGSALTLFPEETSYTAYRSSFSVVLGSGTKGLGFGDSWVVPHQAAVWGVWSVGGEAGAGAGGYETWYNPAKKVKNP